MKMKNKVDGKGRCRGDTKIGKEILAGLHEIQDAMESGEPLGDRFTVRTVNIPDPRPYGAAEVKALRAKLKVSQPVFASLVGASTILVQKWEQGKRNPDGMVRRLFDGINHDPQAWLTLLAKSSGVPNIFSGTNRGIKSPQR